MNSRHSLSPFEAPYALALALKNRAYDRGWLPQSRLAWPVLSIGNLSVGGAGKTPIVIALARLLQAHGFHVDVLSRGYGRRSPQAVERVDPTGLAERFGDEPLLIAQATGAPVYVAASRFAAGTLAEREAAALSKAGIHLLDDAFQHRQLARSIDIVVIHPSDTASHLLPFGRLREPVTALHRADFLILREDDAASEPALRALSIAAPIWRVRRALLAPPVQGSAVAFCAIAHPREFFASLRAAGLDLQAAFAFRDHHRFQPRELQTIAQSAGGAAALLTTEKDLARLTPAARRQLASAAPLFAVPLQAEILAAPSCLAALLTLLAARRSLSAAMRK